MKKMILSFCALVLLTACTTDEKKPVQPEKETQHVLHEEDLKMKNLFWGDGNENGYYRIVTRDKGNGSSISNIMYTDYASKQEIYLCNKPECKHEDTSCTSYLDDFAFDSKVFVYQDHLYIMKSEGTSFTILGDEEKNSSPALLQMDLDGTNKNEIYTPPAGFQFDTSMIVTGNRLYFIISRDENIETGDSVWQISREKYLYAFNVEDKKEEKILDMKDKRFIDAQENRLVIETYHYQQDLDALLNDKKFEAYDNEILHSTSTFSLYEPDNKTWTEDVKAEYPVYGDYGLYYIKDQTLFCRDMKTGQEDDLVKLPDGANYTMSEFRDGYLLLEAWEQKQEEPSFLRSYAIAVDHAVLKEITLVKDAPKEPIVILGEMKDYYFVCYDHKGHMEDTWAGTKQYTTDEEFYGLIKKEDYFASNASYMPIKMLGIGM